VQVVPLDVNGPGLSRRAADFPASPIRRLVPLAEAAESRGIHIYRVNIGQPDIGTPDSIMKIIHEFDRPILSYSHSQGEPALLEALQRYYKRQGFELKRSQIMATTGGSEAIIFAFQIAAGLGDEILVPEPCYPNYLGFAGMCGIRLVPVTTSIDDGFHLPPEEIIESLITDRTRAILICNPSNPTGTVYTRDELDMVARLALRHDLFVLSDEVYREFVYDGADHHSVLSFPELADRCIVLDSASKRFSACGARIGALISYREDVVEAAVRYGQARLSSPQLEQLAVAAVLDVPPSYFENLVSEYRKRRDVVFEALHKMPGVTCACPEGAFYVIVSLPVDDAEKFSRWLLEEFNDSGETVMLAPGAGFYVTKGKGTREVRIAFVLDVGQMQRAMIILATALEQYPYRKDSV